MAQIDWKQADKAVIQQMIHDAEIYLTASITVATSLNTRSGTIGGIFLAASSAILAGLMAMQTPPCAIVKTAIACSAMFVVAAIFCFLATIPANFHLPGTEPKSWYADLENRRCYADVMKGEADYYQKSISSNVNAIKRGACFLRWGMWLGIAAPFLSAIVFLASTVRLSDP